MSEQLLSPDGEWMWDGAEWIPAPPAVQPSPEFPEVPAPQASPAFQASPEDPASQALQAFQASPVSHIPQQLGNQQSVHQVTQSTYYNPMLSSHNPSNSDYGVSPPRVGFQTSFVPWFGIILIAISLLLPYLSVMGLFEMSGFEMMAELGDLFSELVGEDSSSGGGGSDSGIDYGLDPEQLALLIATVMFLSSPFFFAISALLSAIVLLMKKSPRTIGGIHLTFVITFMISAFLSPTALGISIFDFTGIGFYLGAFSSLLLMVK